MQHTVDQNNFKEKLKKLWKITNKPLFVAIVSSLTTGFFSYKAAIATTNKEIDLLKTEIRQEIATSQYQKQIVYNNDNFVLGDEDIKDTPLSSFDANKWNSIKSLKPDKEGFYCPTNRAFISWSMWTTNKYSPNKEVTITFALLDKSNNSKNPTLYFSYGDKSNDIPDTFYRLNIFDGDLNTLRLYGRKGEKELLYERSVNEAPLDKFITFSVSPVLLSKKTSAIALNPSVSYQLDEREYNFEPNDPFEVNLPFSSSENLGDGFNYGIGVSEGDCFKIISTNL